MGGFHGARASARDQLIAIPREIARDIGNDFERLVGAQQTVTAHNADKLGLLARGRISLEVVPESMAYPGVVRRLTDGFLEIPGFRPARLGEDNELLEVPGLHVTPGPTCDVPLQQVFAGVELVDHSTPRVRALRIRNHPAPDTARSWSCRPCEFSGRRPATALSR